MSLRLASAILAAVFALPVATAAATFDVTAAANTVSPSIGADVNGEGVTLTGRVVRDDLSFVRDAAVGFDGIGFGVDGVSGTSFKTGPEVNPNSGEASAFTIDGVVVDDGFDLNEALRLTFARTVEISSLTFGMIDRIDDVTFVIDGADPMRFGLGGNTTRNEGIVTEAISFSTPLRGRMLDIVAGFPNQTCTVTDTQPCGGATDLFQLTGADVAPIPLPAGGVLLLTGLGLVAAMRRRAA